MLVRLDLLGLVSGIRTNSQMKELPNQTEDLYLPNVVLHLGCAHRSANLERGRSQLNLARNQANTKPTLRSGGVL